MDQLYDDESLLNDPNPKSVEVIPEMLDYEFVKRCDDRNELRAILKALTSGEYGLYPDLEETVAKKLISLLPAKEKKKIMAIREKLPSYDVQVEKRNLENWLMNISDDDIKEPNDGQSKEPTPVREVSHIRLSKYSVSVAAKADAPPKENPRPAETKSRKGKQPTRKEKLTTKEYFERWGKFSDSDEGSDDREEITPKRHETNEIKWKEVESKVRRQKELLHLRKRLNDNELTLAERKFMSEREREKGNENFKTGEYDEAANCYSKSILLDGSNAKSYANRALASIRLSDFDQALLDCTEAIKIDSQYGKALLRRGTVYHKKGNYTEAIADFEACLRLDPSNADYTRLLEKSKERLNEERIEEMHRRTKNTLVIEEVTEVDDTPQADCEEYDFVEEVFTPGALETMKKQRQIEASKLKGHFSKVSLDAECVEKDVEDISEVKSNDMSFEIVQKTGLGDISQENYDGDGDFDEAPMRRVEIIVDDDSDDEDVATGIELKVTENTTESNSRESIDASDKLKEQGNQAMKRHHYDSAIDLYSRSFDLNPKNASAMNNRALAKLKMKKYEEAVIDASKCLTLEPDNTKALYRRGCAKMMQDTTHSKTKDALDDFQQAATLNPPDEQKLVLMRKIEECRRLLSMKKQSSEQAPKKEAGDRDAVEKKKIRNHDTTALCF